MAPFLSKTAGIIKRKDFEDVVVHQQRRELIDTPFTQEEKDLLRRLHVPVVVAPAVPEVPTNAAPAGVVGVEEDVLVAAARRFASMNAAPPTRDYIQTKLMVTRHRAATLPRNLEMLAILNFNDVHWNEHVVQSCINRVVPDPEDIELGALVDEDAEDE